MPQGKLDLTCIAFTVGTAILAVLQWLQDLRWDHLCTLKPAITGLVFPCIGHAQEHCRA